MNKKPNNKNSGNNKNQKNQNQQKQAIKPAAKPRPKTTDVARSASRGEAIRAQRRNHDDVSKLLNQYKTAEENGKPKRANVINDSPRLKVIGLGGVDVGGSNNMIVLEYKDEAIVIDCGNNLGVDLPGINYAISDVTYLEQIKHKLKAYVITHGHLDHIGGLPHIVPRYPAPIYGSNFTVGMVERIFENFGVPMPDGFKLQTVSMNETTHEKLKASCSATSKRTALWS